MAAAKQYEFLQDWSGEEGKEGYAAGAVARIPAKLAKDLLAQGIITEAKQAVNKQASPTPKDEARKDGRLTYHGLVITSPISDVEKNGKTYKRFKTINGQTFVVSEGDAKENIK